MLLLGDDGHYHGRMPWVTFSLVGINIAVFIAQCLLGEPFTNGFSLVPAEITHFKDLKRIEYEKVRVPFARSYDNRGHAEVLYETRSVPIRHYPGPFPIFLTLFTSMFLHGDLMHLLGNMWFLLVFGRNVECAMHHGRFLAFYTLCGIAGGLAHVASTPNSVMPCLGASGAISGVMGAYLAVHPFNMIRVWLGLWFGVVKLPALLVIGVWFGLQYLSVYRSQTDVSYVNNVAHWAHIGGFLSGFVMVFAMILYLRARVAEVARELEVEATAPIEAELVPEVILVGRSEAMRAAPDPFANCLPRS